MKVFLKLNNVGHARLVLPRIVESNIQVAHQILPGQFISHILCLVCCGIAATIPYRRVLNSTNRETIVPIVVVLRIDIRTIEVQVVCVGTIVERGRPVVPVGTTIVERRTIVVASSRQENPSIGYHLSRWNEGITYAKPTSIFCFSHGLRTQDE